MTAISEGVFLIMKVFRRTCALALMVMMLFGFTATAFALPKGFNLSDSMPKTVE